MIHGQNVIRHRAAIRRDSTINYPLYWVGGKADDVPPVPVDYIEIGVDLLAYFFGAAAIKYLGAELPNPPCNIVL